MSRVGTMRANCSLSISSPSEIVALSPRVTAASCVRWRRAALQPQRSETLKLSTDRLFVDKVRGIVGLCLDPPDRALEVAAWQDCHNPPPMPA